MAKILYFHLQGLCMSYGESARWANRETSEFPTLSGIVGMIANGFGYDRSDPRIAELSHNLSVGSRCDTKGTIITDFQTAHSDKFTQANGKENYSTTIVRRKVYRCTDFRRSNPPRRHLRSPNVACPPTDIRQKMLYPRSVY